MNRGTAQKGGREEGTGTVRYVFWDGNVGGGREAAAMNRMKTDTGDDRYTKRKVLPGRGRTGLSRKFWMSFLRLKGKKTRCFRMAYLNALLDDWLSVLSTFLIPVTPESVRTTSYLKSRCINTNVINSSSNKHSYMFNSAI